MELVKCTVGHLKQEECHQKSYTNKENLLAFQDLNDNEKSLLCKRLKVLSIHNICSHHYCHYIEYFANGQRKCCNPFEIYKSACTFDLREISLQLCNDAENNDIQLIPGLKLCLNCRIKVSQLTKRKRPFAESSKECVEEDLNQPSTSKQSRYDLRPITVTSKDCHPSQNSQNFTSSATATTGSDEEYVNFSQQCRNINEKLALFGYDPLSKKYISDENYCRLALEMIDQVTLALKIDIERAFDVLLPEISILFYKDHEALEVLMSNLKVKYEQATTYDERVHLLTLLPDHWDFQKASEFFNCSRYVYNEAKTLKNNEGKYTQFKK